MIDGVGQGALYLLPASLDVAGVCFQSSHSQRTVERTVERTDRKRLFRGQHQHPGP